MDATQPADSAELAPLVALARDIQERMLAEGSTLATAESCTGGLIAHVLTEIPGSSAYFVGGIVSYSNALKERELAVPADTLERHGAVSAQTCVAMAQGARQRYGADTAVAVTGIAGPDGGTDAKPVGLTYVGVADATGHDVRRFVWTGDRHENKLRSAEAALSLVLERLDAPRD
jgi:PncC family amidohydrolase